MAWATKQPFRASDTFEIIRWILKWIDAAEVVQPAAEALLQFAHTKEARRVG